MQSAACAGSSQSLSNTGAWFVLFRGRGSDRARVLGCREVTLIVGPFLRGRRFHAGAQGKGGKDTIERVRLSRAIGKSTRTY